MIEVFVGSSIPLFLQVYDGATDLKVSAFLVDETGKEFGRVKLRHMSRGLYANLETSMPNVPILIAQYETGTEEKYQVVQDIFKSVQKPEAPEKFLVGEVIEKGIWDDKDLIIGEVYDREEAQDPE